jgi:ABC-type antimicrobial peptide transport system ATPase subunit
MRTKGLYPLAPAAQRPIVPGTAVLLARALMRRPCRLILDEPTAGVDVGLRANVSEYIRRLHERLSRAGTSARSAENVNEPSADLSSADGGHEYGGRRSPS